MSLFKVAIHSYHPSLNENSNHSHDHSWISSNGTRWIGSPCNTYFAQDCTEKLQSVVEAMSNSIQLYFIRSHDLEMPDRIIEIEVMSDNKSRGSMIETARLRKDQIDPSMSNRTENIGKCTKQTEWNCSLSKLEFGSRHPEIKNFDLERLLTCLQSRETCIAVWAASCLCLLP